MSKKRAAKRPPKPTNKEIVVSIAVAVLQGKGIIEEPEDDVLSALERLYEQHPAFQVEVKFTDDQFTNLLESRPGEYLAGAYEQELEEYWQRHEAPRWSCPCGVTFGLIMWWPKKATFYTLTKDGLFDQEAKECPNCARKLTDARKHSENPQLSLDI